MSTKYSGKRKKRREYGGELPKRKARKVGAFDYSTIARIDGTHDWRKAVPGAYVDYDVRLRHGGSVRYFNFDLAKEMGLIPNYHPSILNPKLERMLLQTFGIQIINEYDIARNTKFPSKDIKPNKYMATRYLQLQHKNKTGVTSGDGRSIWNGQFRGRGNTWDVSSCGTGVTCLSPGAVEADKPIKTGGGSYAYGSGRAGLDEGVSAAVLSEIFHNLGLNTERVLAVIEYSDGSAINVRASKNLIRPSHFFNHLKQGNLDLLTSGVDYFIERQIKNDGWDINTKSPAKYDQFLKLIAEKYAQFTALLEDEYVFCWLDWDGDNMLATGGIIDYGSIRKLGICHHKYRYDDVERMSTNLFEQKQKARYLVQTFAQLVDYLNTGEKKPVSHFAETEALVHFEESFKEAKRENMLRMIGLNTNQKRYMLESHPEAVDRFLKVYRWFEKQKNHQGYRKVGDGINWAAVYSMRNALCYLPRHLHQQEGKIDPESFLKIISADTCPKSFLELNNYRRSKICEFQSAYQAILEILDNKKQMNFRYTELIMRANEENNHNVVTGDGIIFVTERLLRSRKKLSRNQFLSVVQKFIVHQAKRKTISSNDMKKLDRYATRVLEALFNLVHSNRHSI